MDERKENNFGKLPRTTCADLSTFSSTSLITALTFSNNKKGSCSYHPGWGLIRGISWEAIATISVKVY